MTRSEARTPDAWRAFDRAALFVALAGLVTLLLLWWSGHGPLQASCCAAPVVAAATTPTLPAPIVAPTPEPPKDEPAKAEPPPVAVAATASTKATPTVECNRTVEGLAVHFASGSAALIVEARSVLDQASACVKEGSYEIAGHTDSVGSHAANQTLSEARAAAVVAYLRTTGLDAARLRARGYGETKPIADNSTAEGRAQNRRVNFVRLQ
jgi:OOP family OmpA-OmpF porin